MQYRRDPMDGATKIRDDGSADSGLLSVHVLGLLLGGGPSGGHQLGDSGARLVAGQLGDHVAQVGEGIDPSECAIAQHGADDRMAASALVGPAEQVVSPAQRDHAVSALDVQVGGRRMCNLGLLLRRAIGRSVRQFTRLERKRIQAVRHGPSRVELVVGQLGYLAGLGPGHPPKRPSAGYYLSHRPTCMTAPSAGEPDHGRATAYSTLPDLASPSLPPMQVTGPVGRPGRER